MGWTHGLDEISYETLQRYETKKRRLRKTRKTTAKMGYCLKRDLRKAEACEKW